MRWALLLALVPSAAPAVAPWPTDTRYHVRVDSQLTADRWRGRRPDPVDRTDVVQRLRLGAFGADDGDGPGWRLNLDLEVGSDLGPTLRELEALPDERRVRLDAHAVELTVRDIAGAVDLRLGRHVLYDALGFDAVDGATARVHLVPHLVVEGSAGLAARRGWSDFGPDIYEPDGTALADDPGYVLGAAVETRDVTAVRARGSWRRLADEEIQRAEAGVGVGLGPWAGWSFDGGGRYDTVFLRWVDLWAGTAADLGPARVGARWRRVSPTFSADSIWNAFGAEPYDALDGSLGLALGPWRVTADGGARLFHADADAGDAGLRVVRVFELLAREAQAGVEGRSGFGYGGRRAYGDAFAKVPLPTQAPLWLRVRAGAVRTTGTSGWGLLALSWQAAEQVRVEALTEAYGSDDLPYRVRAMGRLVVEEWL